MKVLYKLRGPRNHPKHRKYKQSEDGLRQCETLWVGWVRVREDNSLYRENIRSRPWISLPILNWDNICNNFATNISAKLKRQSRHFQNFSERKNTCVSAGRENEKDERMRRLWSGLNNAPALSGPWQYGRLSVQLSFSLRSFPNGEKALYNTWLSYVVNMSCSIKHHPLHRGFACLFFPYPSLYPIVAFNTLFC